MTTMETAAGGGAPRSTMTSLGGGGGVSRTTTTSCLGRSTTTAGGGGGGCGGPERSITVTRVRAGTRQPEANPTQARAIVVADNFAKIEAGGVGFVISH